MAENTQLPTDLVSLWAEQPDGMEHALRWIRDAVEHTYATRQVRIHSPEDAASLFVDMNALEQEHLRALLLDARQQIIKVAEIAKGSTSELKVRVAEIFREAVRVNATAIILVHNHPSGDPTPSPEDVRFTEKVIEAGKVLDIKVQDHLVIGGGKFVSIRERHPRPVIAWPYSGLPLID